MGNPFRCVCRRVERGRLIGPPASGVAVNPGSARIDQGLRPGSQSRRADQRLERLAVERKHRGAGIGRGMNDHVAVRGRAGECLRFFESAENRPDLLGGEPSGLRGAPGLAQDLVPRSPECAGDRAADGPGRAGDEHLHEPILCARSLRRAHGFATTS